MKFIKITATLLFTASICTLNAQQVPDASTETVEKTYRLTVNGETIKNSVKINTTVSLGTYDHINSVKGIQKDSMTQKKKITKTVKVDNDLDNSFDEVIKFSYNADEKVDFTILSNRNNLIVGIDKGEDLEILESAAVIKKDSNDVETLVITDNDGKKIELYVESYEAIQ